MIVSISFAKSIHTLIHENVLVMLESHYAFSVFSAVIRINTSRHHHPSLSSGHHLILFVGGCCITMAMGVPCYKVILCGEYGVGKSSLFRRFIDNSFTTQEGPRSTMGLDYFSKTYTIHDREIKVKFKDVISFAFHRVIT